MRGHIRRRGSPGTWTITYELGVQPAQRCRACDARYWIERRPLDSCPKCSGELRETRERRQKTQGGFSRRKDAEAALVKIVQTLNTGTYVAPSRLTLGEFLRDMWLPSLKNGRLRPSTLLSYETHVTHHLLPRLGGTPLQRLNRDMIGAHYAWLLSNGRVPRRTPKAKGAEREAKGTTRTSLSPATVRRVHATLHRAMRDAVRSHLLPLNPADDVEMPEGKKIDRTLSAWNSEQLRGFLQATTDDREGTMWLLFATTGARRGELLGLTWDDIDLEAATATIRRNVTPVGYGLSVGEPKTKSGRRTIALPAVTVTALKRLRTLQEAERRWSKGIWGATRAEVLRGLALVFTDEAGRELHPDRVSKLFDRAVAKSGQPRICLHGLRHTFATIALIEGKQPVSVVSQRLGHANTGITLDFYSHAMPRHDVEAADAVASLIAPQGI